MFRIEIKKLLVPIIAFTVFVAVSAGAKSSELKIAVVDMDSVFQQYYKTKQTDAVLKQKQGIYQAWAKKLGESRLKLEEEFKILRDASQNIAYSSAEREKNVLPPRRNIRSSRKKKRNSNNMYNRKAVSISSFCKKCTKRSLTRSILR